MQLSPPRNDTSIIEQPFVRQHNEERVRSLSVCEIKPVYIPKYCTLRKLECGDPLDVSWDLEDDEVYLEYAFDNFITSITINTIAKI